MSLSDTMVEGVDEVDGIVEAIRHYLTGPTWGYKGEVFGEVAELIEVELLEVREKMVVLAQVLNLGGIPSVEFVDTYGMPGAVEKLIAARAVVEKLTGVSVHDGNDVSRPKLPANNVEPGHWQRLVA